MQGEGCSESESKSNNQDFDICNFDFNICVCNKQIFCECHLHICLKKKKLAPFVTYIAFMQKVFAYFNYHPMMLDVGWNNFQVVYICCIFIAKIVGIG